MRIRAVVNRGAKDIVWALVLNLTMKVAMKGTLVPPKKSLDRIITKMLMNNTINMTSI